MPPRKLNVHQRIAVVEQWQRGTAQNRLAAEYGVAVATITKIINDAGLKRYGDEPDLLSDLEEPKKELSQYAKFVRDAKEILRAQTFDGKGVDSHTTWMNWVESLQSEGFTRPQAVVQGSKAFACLRLLYMKYDIWDFDIKPDSHPDVKHKRDMKESEKSKVVPNEGRELSYRENIRWAAAAAGRWFREKKQPESTPNDTAWFLYVMAQDAPKDFGAKLSQVESKDIGEGEDERLIKREGLRMIKQLDDMLEELSIVEGEEEND